nr:MAG TPA: hypothetical protein [Caudoviricetes sp.]
MHTSPCKDFTSGLGYWPVSVGLMIRLAPGNVLLFMRALTSG